MTFAIWSPIIGILLSSMVLSSTLLKRLPLSTAMLYLAAGLVLGPPGWAVLTPHPLTESIVAITLTAVTASIIIHGISVRPMMRLYRRREAR